MLKISVKPPFMTHAAIFQLLSLSNARLSIVTSAMHHHSPDYFRILTNVYGNLIYLCSKS